MNQPERIHEVYAEFGIDEERANDWLRLYMKSENIVRVHIEKRKNRSEPPDSFEPLREIALKMLNIGSKDEELRRTTDPSWLDSAKTWAICRLKEKIYTDGDKVRYGSKPEPPAPQAADRQKHEAAA